MTETPLTIRFAETSDALAIADIYNEAIRSTTATFDTEPKSEADRKSWLASHDERHPVWVAEVDGKVVGWAAITAWSDRPAYNETGETSFYVAEVFRGQGIGRALKSHLIAEARRLGYYTLLARMAEGSEASIHINKSFGFRHIGTMKDVGFKFGRRLDVHLMQLMLHEDEHMELFAIGRNGELPDDFTPDDHLTMIVEMTVSHYEKTGFPTPWIGYIAMRGQQPVGVCGFKSAPVDGRVEIAYGTLPGYEGKGVATEMATALIQIARQHEAPLTVFAQTLPEENASTSILKKLGFTMTGPVEHPEDGPVWEWELR